MKYSITEADLYALTGIPQDRPLTEGENCVAQERFPNIKATRRLNNTAAIAIRLLKLFQKKNGHS